MRALSVFNERRLKCVTSSVDRETQNGKKFCGRLSRDEMIMSDLFTAQNLFFFLFGVLGWGGGAFAKPLPLPHLPKNVLFTSSRNKN